MREVGTIDNRWSGMNQGTEYVIWETRIG